MQEPKNDEDPGKFDYLRDYAKYSGILFQMIAMVVAGIFGGRELDRLFDLKGHLFLIILTLLASFGAVYYLFRALMKKQ